MWLTMWLTGLKAPTNKLDSKALLRSNKQPIVVYIYVKCEGQTLHYVCLTRESSKAASSTSTNSVYIYVMCEGQTLHSVCLTRECSTHKQRLHLHHVRGSGLTLCLPDQEKQHIQTASTPTLCARVRPYTGKAALTNSVHTYVNNLTLRLSDQVGTHGADTVDRQTR